MEFSVTGLSPSTAGHPRPLHLTPWFITPAPAGRQKKNVPQHRTHNPCRVSHAHGLAILRVRSPLLTESLTCFLFLRVLRCFTSPRSPPTPIHSALGDTTSLVPGFPIRTSSDQRSVDSSPRLIAASYVLHRLPVPRHPPCALKHLQTQNQLQKNLKLHIKEQQPQPPDTTTPHT